MIYIYIARGGAGNAVGPFSEDGESVWKDSFVELRRGKNVDRDLGKNGKSLNPILGIPCRPLSCREEACLYGWIQVSETEALADLRN